MEYQLQMCEVERSVKELKERESVLIQVLKVSSIRAAECIIEAQQQRILQLEPSLMNEILV